MKTYEYKWKRLPVIWPDVERDANKMGKQGWELMSIENGLFYKREIE